MNDRLVALIDMDCFYCQVETRLNPSLKGKPMAVVQYNQWKGGGIIAVNYEARDRGVTRHMRGAEAKTHCPEIQLVSVPVVRGKADLTKYRDAGREVIKVICEFSECVQRASVDEAFVDLTEAVQKLLLKNTKVTPIQLENTFVVGFSAEDNNDEVERERGVCTWLEEVYSTDLSDPDLHRLATAAALVEQIRTAVFDKTGFRCSAGISHNKILAKLVCGLHKPNRQTVLPMSRVAELFRSLPVKKVRNLGGKLGKDVVETLGITYMAELANFTEKQLQTKYDEKTGTWLYNIARGIDLDPVTPRLISQSIGCRKNFPGKTALATKEKVTHWLSELAAEVAERLDEDLHMNKRKAQLLTIHFTQGIGGRDVAMSRSVVLPGYDAEKISACAFSILSKNCSASSSDDSWYPPLKCLGLSAGKFNEFSGNSSHPINKFFKVTATATSSKTNCDNIVSNSRKDLNDMIPIENIESSMKEKISEEIVNFDSTSEMKNSTTNKPKERVSFFENYFKNQQNKTSKSSTVICENQNISARGSLHSNKHLEENNYGDSSTPNQSRQVNEDLDVQGNVNRLEEQEGEKTTSETMFNNGEEAWISPSEIFPDLENIDDSIVNMLPSPLQRKISDLKQKTVSSSGCKTEPSNSRASADSDCAPSKVETVVDIHASPCGTSVQQSSVSISTRGILPTEDIEEESIEPEGLFDKTSLDIFELESSEKLEEEEIQSEVCNKCSYCEESFPLSQLQEHLDHHVAMELHEQLNKEPQSDRPTIPKEVKTKETVTAVSERKKRGRPSKKDTIAPKKSRTIMSFFTKS